MKSPTWPPKLRRGVRADIIVKRFQAGHTIENLIGWYDCSPQSIEYVIRQELRRKHKRITEYHVSILRKRK